MQAQSQLGGFAHPGLALVLFTLLAGTNQARDGAHTTAPPSPSVHVGQLHDPQRRPGPPIARGDAPAAATAPTEN